MSSRILIAEDERNLVSFLEKGLRAAGYVTTAVERRPVARSRSPATRTSS